VGPKASLDGRVGEKFFGPTGVRTPNRPVRRVVDILTTLSLLHNSLVLVSIPGGGARLYGARDQ
jgi:hypothetical protein